jgi:tRNA G46 methylase TrmB
VRVGFVNVISRINDAHPWSHNDAYAAFVLRHARAVRRRGGDVAVDVGCGTGNLLRRLSGAFPTLIGIEPMQRPRRSLHNVSVARRRSGSSGGGSDPNRATHTT